MKVADIDPQVFTNLEKLQEKYAHTDQGLSTQLEGLYHAQLPNYWKYLNLDTLLTLQNPRTDFPDEMIFVTFHQIAELKFKLIQWELDQISEGHLNADQFLEKVQRVIRYYDMIINGFAIVHDGMDVNQFRQFRMSLVPSSGYQSAQYRCIEFKCTDVHNLIYAKQRAVLRNEQDVDTLYDNLYWKSGMLENCDGKLVVALDQIEKKYKGLFLELIRTFKQKNLWQVYVRNYVNHTINTKLEESLRHLDTDRATANN